MKKSDVTFYFLTKLFVNLQEDLIQFLRACDQYSNTFTLPMLQVFDEFVRGQTLRDSRDWSIQCEARKQNEETTGGVKLRHEPNAQTEISYLTYLYNLARDAIFKGVGSHKEQLLHAFDEAKGSKRSRCGVLGLVRLYENFASATSILYTKPRQTGDMTDLLDLESIHKELIHSLIVSVERLSDQCTKTSKQMVQMENYHLLSDIISRLRIPILSEVKTTTKQYLNNALEEYTAISLGQPLSELQSFLEAVQRSGISVDRIKYQQEFSKQKLIKVVKLYPLREVQKGLEQVKKKIDKQLNPEESLATIVWRSVQSEFLKQIREYNDLIQRCYQDPKIQLEFTTKEVEEFFVHLAAQ
ncbi:Exocyst complex component 1 [Cichlidogyrus casuarinus]|uniref:Exocyst complex component 1 n=1 Tax=Cichlidogyrus casuarinus TaxID=1844966 RepID=A0ABD2QCT4_9PLAT